MGEWFPEWEFYESIAERIIPTKQGTVREKAVVIAWEGFLQPLPTDPAEAMKILADLARDREVLVTRGGTLEHKSNCREQHIAPDPVRNRRDYGTVFRLLVHQFAPPTHPKAYALQPYLGPELIHTQGHVNGDGSLCPLSAADGVWDGRTDTLAKYLRKGVSPLLAKHLYWQWIYDATGRNEWPGARGPHGRLEAILATMARGSDSPCWCGSGKEHAECHRDLDVEELSRSATLRARGT